MVCIYIWLIYLSFACVGFSSMVCSSVFDTSVTAKSVVRLTLIQRCICFWLLFVRTCVVVSLSLVHLSISWFFTYSWLLQPPSYFVELSIYLGPPSYFVELSIYLGLRLHL